MIQSVKTHRRRLDTLEHCLKELKRRGPDEISYDSYRAACVKEFEIILEQSGNLLRKVLGAYFADNRRAGQLVFKDIFRHAAKHGLIDPETCERWLSYRDNRNDTRRTAMERVSPRARSNCFRILWPTPRRWPT